jgi:hypothetical protein
MVGELLYTQNVRVVFPHILAPYKLADLAKEIWRTQLQDAKNDVLPGAEDERRKGEAQQGMVQRLPQISDIGNTQNYSKSTGRPNAADFYR